ncbi:MAG: hypothetical protein KTR15_03660 [Phycisphaeraceae bacterium]|nr:hypothetical protein [Phycisphaeraceae bacterium]
MSLAHPNAEQIAQQYLSSRDAEVVDRCGYGKEGVVFKSSRGTAVKVHSSPDTFRNEYLAYRRLAETKTEVVRGFSVPRPINANGELQIIEMGIVEPPFLLDFGTSLTDIKPDFTAEVWEDWWGRVQENFEEHFAEAEAVFYYLQRKLNIWHLDLRPSNLRFAGE